MIDRTLYPNQLILSANDIKLLKLNPDLYTLDNGINVHFFNSEATELVKIDFFFDAGTIYQPKFFLASASNELLTEGSTNKTAKEIADFLDYRGAYIEKNLEKETASISIYMLRKYAEDLLPLLAEILYEPAYKESELKIYIQKRKQQYLIENKKVNFVARKYFTGLIFGNEHPYGKRGEYEDFDLVQATDLTDFHHKYYLNACRNILASGYIDKEILSLINKYFGAQNNANKTTPVNFPNPISRAKKTAIEMPETMQSALRIGKNCIHTDHADFHKLMVLNTVLGGYFGSRLMKNIREEKGYTYGIYSGIYPFQEVSMFVIAAEVASGTAQKAIDEIYIELKRLRTEPVAEEELDLVKNYLVGDFIRSMDGVFELSEKYKNILTLSETTNYYQKYIDTLKGITIKDLQEIAEKHLHEDSMCELLVGKFA